MDIASTLSADWQFFDDRETVTYHRALSNSPAAYDVPVEVEDAVRGSPSKSDAEYLAKAEVTWDVWAAKLEGVVPKVGDVVEEAPPGGREWLAAARWAVGSVEVCDEATRYHLVCIREPRHGN